MNETILEREKRRDEIILERERKREEILQGVRTCTVCHLTKPLSCFYPKECKPHYYPRCKQCHIKLTTAAKRRRRVAMRAANRLPSETFTLFLSGGGLALHQVDVSIARNPTTKELIEVIFVGRGKIGHGLDMLLTDLGIQLSRAIQGRIPIHEDDDY